MTGTINQMALLAAKDERVREDLIRSQELTILRTASVACHKYIDESDDEWSIALCAFSKAIDLYEEGKGEFLPFAQMIVKRSLIDYYRLQKNAMNEVPIAPYVLEGGGEPEEDTLGAYPAIVKVSQETDDHSLTEEIEAANELLKTYGFRFYDLTECSPKQEKTRQECAVAIRYMLSDEDLRRVMKKSRKLPIKALAEFSGVSRKTLDRYRKYLIMAVLILEGDFPQLAEYLKFVKTAPMQEKTREKAQNPKPKTRFFVAFNAAIRG
ncbi:MAG: hypothetical protein IJ773_05510 [Lachnospiraceae bacterium]|nr:hypothetical protein [Lachnospiraceae bacterium]